MNKEFNPDVVTYTERPSQEAIKAASFINKYMYWMCNKSNRQALINALGPVLGEHFWQKLIQCRTNCGTPEGDIHLWMEMNNNNRDALMNYILKTNYKPFSKE